MTSNPAPNAMLDFVRTYHDQPTRFVTEVLGVTPLDYQAEFLEAICSGERMLSVRSGHGTGKSTTASWAMLHTLLMRFPCKIIVTAPTSGQLFDALYNELRKWINELPPPLRELLNVKSDRVELIAAPSEAFISARTSRKETPEALAGIHQESGVVLLICDEASAIDEAVYEAAAGSMSGRNTQTVLLSNPTRSSGTFYESQTRMAHKWWTRRWSCLDSPLVSDQFIDEMKERYGEESAAYSIRVLGDFAKADSDTIIGYDLVHSAMHRDVEVDPNARIYWACDPSRFGDDRTAFVKRQGNVITEITSWRGLDLMQTTGRIMAEWDALEPSRRPCEILVDSIGLGGGIVDRLAELGVPVRGINVAEAPSMKGTYNNLRTELWFKAKAYLEERSCRLPKNDELLADLTGIRYSFSSSGKLQAESKDSMRKRGLPSPDLGDAICLIFSSDAATMISGPISRWRGAIRRNLQGVA